ncbi:sensor histidine kinase [Salidesulfovibrio onnuriiensis]|uniref:sensor histidine kinase n=1 Tax=Salidesulfovibrio onnuriiensis TaxID=2583823 RepID=UPI0011CA581E|nr:HAMP domain-containing sensor histidine kinase [Salidesulfovibrio onnuriiensis]
MNSIYMTGRAMFGNAPLTIHILHPWRKHREEQWFMNGLLLMSVVAALLLIPCSRRITKPLNELTRSARKMAEGDFSPRVQARARDELSVLAGAFNHMAESLEKMIRGGRELTANLSHELRSPLARIRFSQQIILDKVESGKTDGVLDHVRKMEAEIDHMDGLIDEIIALSKRDLQEAPPRNDVVDMAALLDEAMERQQQLMQQKSVSMARAFEPMPGYRCNESDMRIVLDNVLSNAVKYCPEGSAISVGGRADGGFISLRITNPYPPLSEEELETVFLPFKRLGYEDVDGSGLGLAFARKIVEEHGGSMQASNEPEGFRMTLRLPLGHREG